MDDFFKKMCFYAGQLACLVLVGVRYCTCDIAHHVAHAIHVEHCVR